MWKGGFGLLSFKENKMHLSDKITTLEEYLTATAPDGTKVRDYVSGSGASQTLVVPGGATPTGTIQMLPLVSTGFVGAFKSTEYIPVALWWVHRELLRMALGVYPPSTQALRHVSALAPFQHLLLHVSKEDPSMVAFTANTEDGIRDRQTRIAFGRFIRRYYNFVQAPAIAAIEAAHRTELNPPVEFIVAEKNPDEFIAAYKAVNSCMSKSDSTFGTQGMHPVASYCTPGFQLAVLRNSNGGISARSLVWINPENPEDKRYVRTYGDQVLHNYLKKNDFKPKAFEPAYLKTKRLTAVDSSGCAQLVVPYVDPGAEASSSEQNSGQGVWDGDERIYLLKSATRLKIPDIYRMSVQSSSGVSTGRAFPINRTCSISGKPINGLVDQFVTTFFGGKEGVALASEIKDHVSCIPAYGTRATYFEPGTLVFKHGSGTYLDCTANREAMGYARLDANFYPTEQDWFLKSSSNYVGISGGRLMPTRFIKAEDLAIYIARGGLVTRMHRNEVPKDAERVAAIEDVKTWVSKDTETVRTVANRKVVPGVHPVKQMYNGKWNYTRHLRQITILGEKLWVPLDHDLATLEITTLPEAARAQVQNACEAMAVYGNAKKRALFDVFASRGDMLVPLRDAANGKLEAGYIFEYRSLPMKLVESYLAADYVADHVTNAPAATMQVFHKFGRMVLAAFEVEWAKVHPKEAVPAPETAVMA